MEWETEPDSLDLRDGPYPIAIRRHPTLKHLCGYVGIDKSHPYYGRTDVDLEVHGGVTYEGYAVPREEPDGRFWFGFDCAHAWDLVPGLDRHDTTDVYRDIDYVKSEAESLARQLDEARVGLVATPEE